MPFRLNIILGKYMNSDFHGLESFMLFCLWLGCGKNIRNKSENSHIVGTDKVMMFTIDHLKC